jgi:hypothetical protein
MNGDLTAPGSARGLSSSTERRWRVDVMEYGDIWHATYLVSEPRGCVADSTDADALEELVQKVTGFLHDELSQDSGCEQYHVEWRFAEDNAADYEPAPVDWLYLPELPSTVHASGKADFHHFPWPCEAYRDGPDGGPRCDEPAVFSIHRVMDTALPVCAAHLGPVLCTAPTVEWPFTTWSEIEWIGPGERPPNAMSPEAADAHIEKITGFAVPPPAPDPYEAGISAKYAGTCTACQTAIAVGDRIFIGYRTSGDRKLWVCETCHTTGAATEHFFGGGSKASRT